MSTTIDTRPETKTADDEPSLVGALAFFDSEKHLVEAIRALRVAGLHRLESHSPYPIHGIDEELGIQPTKLPWLVLGGALVGAAGAFAMQHWMNGMDYPFLISGKPLFSVPSSIPVTFEVAILLAAFAAFLGVLALNGLPRLANPIMKVDAFRSVSNDQFALFADTSDQNFEAQRFRTILNEHGVTNVVSVETDQSSTRMPSALKSAAVVLGVLALIPPALIANARMAISERPRIHPIQDMDFQPKFKAQTTSPLFDDGSAMRPQVAGTMARGDLPPDPTFVLGYEEAGDARSAPQWLERVPLAPTASMIERGRERFNIFCAACHGRGGDGDGIVTVRALELQQGTWVRPISLHDKSVRAQPDGKLFDTITNGVRKMPGYASQIKPDDRWAIVLYLRALQKSRDGSIDIVPDNVRSTLRELN